MVDTRFFTTPRHAWIDSQPIFQHFGCRNNKTAVFGIILGILEIEIQSNFSFLHCADGESFEVDRNIKFALIDLLMDTYERDSQSPL